MKVVMLREPEHFELIDLPDPEPRTGEVLLRIEACSVCGSDLEGYHGIHPKMTFPRVMGHEYAGTVIGHGEGVETPKIGTRVASVGNVGCGTCVECKAGRYSDCEGKLSPGFTTHGAYAEYLAVPADSCYELPEALTFEEAAVAQPLSIAYHAVATRAKVTDSDFVVVQGCGPIGLGAMMHARAAGATVLSTDPLEYRREMAGRLGASYTVDPYDVDLSEYIRTVNNGLRADIVIECVGAAQDDTIPQAVNCVESGGLVVVVGSFAVDRATVPIIDFKFNEKSLIGSQSMPEGYGPTFQRLVAGTVQAKPLITHRIGIADVPETFRLLDQKLEGIVKAIVVPS